MSAIAAAAPVLLVLLLALAGWPLAVHLRGGRGQRIVLATIAGAVVLHLGLTALQLAGIRWTASLVVAVLGAAAAALAAVTVLSRSTTAAERRPSIGWGDGVAAASVALFAVLAWLLPVLNSDFINHWGIKGRRYALAGGVDHAFLAHAWNWITHPDYPNLMPELYAATALLGGGWHESPQMVWSVAWFALLLLAVREILSLGALSRFAHQASLAALGLGIAGFAVANQMAGSADWGPALALAAAAPALLRPADGRGDLQVGLCAAFAAGSKMEGVVLAAVLVGVQLLRRSSRGPSRRVLGATALVLPPALVIGPWLWTVVRLDLFQRFNAGSLSADKVLATGAGVAQMSLLGGWHGLGLALVLLPVLLLVPRLRPLVVVLGAQLAFYLWTYSTANVGTPELVVASYPRLLLHLLPTLLATLAVTALAEGPADDQGATAAAAATGSSAASAEAAARAVRS